MPDPPKTAIEIQGREYDWLAGDAADHVGFFSTAGGGYAPPEMLRDTDAHYDAIEAILALPSTTTARCAPEVPDHLVNTWRLVAERGLYALDSDYYGGPYRLVAVPRLPILITELPVAVGDLVAQIRYGKLQFGADEALTRAQLQR